MYNVFGNSIVRLLLPSNSFLRYLLNQISKRRKIDAKEFSHEFKLNNSENHSNESCNVAHVACYRLSTTEGEGKVVVITEDVQNVHLLLEYRPHIDVSLTCEHDPKLQEYCVGMEWNGMEWNLTETGTDGPALRPVEIYCANHRYGMSYMPQIPYAHRDSLNDRSLKPTESIYHSCFGKFSQDPPVGRRRNSSPDLLEEVFRKLPWGRKHGISIDGRKLTNVSFADDVVLFATSRKRLDLCEESMAVGLTMNTSKTKLLTNDAEGHMIVNNANIEFVTQYIYLGQTISFQNSMHKEIDRRIASAWKKF
ncbi:hypothetical protein ANN_14879 [Periplaneta americana]|uniref:Reverse transcriptase domain-containing protein n=1 Tax=Periplaneta americana TaxID=6978 RepID=A0ABQ8SXI5_PERAM|nr:hypothetical protein ANN_14879 [Periplaneta americana]